MSSTAQESSTVPTIRLYIETVTGRKFTGYFLENATAFDVKQTLTKVYGIQAESQFLVRCGDVNGQERYLELDDAKTLQQAGVLHNDRILMIPKMRTGFTPGKVFVENEKADNIIDRMLKECGKQRKEDHRYILAQLAEQKEGDYTIFEISESEAESSQPESSNPPPQRVLTKAEIEENVKTKGRMLNIRKKINTSKSGKKPKKS